MRIWIFESAQETAHALAEDVAAAVRQRPALVLGLPAGRTPIAVYEKLRETHRTSALDFSATLIVMVDEFVGGPAPGPFRTFLQRHLLDGINVPENRVRTLDGHAADLYEECADFEKAIAAAGGVDLQILGIGANGHIAFNEPGHTLTARTHVATLRDETRQQNAGEFGGDYARVPAQALTMGIGTILDASAIAIMATGERKASAVAAMIEGPLTTMCPASFLQLHRNVCVYLDRAAAAALSEARAESAPRADE